MLGHNVRKIVQMQSCEVFLAAGVFIYVYFTGVRVITTLGQSQHHSGVCRAGLDFDYRYDMSQESYFLHLWIIKVMFGMSYCKSVGSDTIVLSTNPN